MISKYGILLALLTVCLSPASGAISTLGDPAPPLVVTNWIKGPPLDVTAGTNIYVVELWASWNTDHRAFSGTQNTFSPAYSSRSSRIF